MPERDRGIELKDGRMLAFTEHGDLAGYPVLFLHGNPSSRLMRHPDETIAEKLGAHIITPDRPGYGLSDYQPGRTLLDYPVDLVQLVDALEIDEFALFGVSAGGPYVAATAYALPDRISCAAIVSGAAPMNRRGAFDGMHQAWKTAFRASRDLPGWMLRMPLWIQSRSARNSSEQALTNFASMLTESDRAKLQQPEIRERVMRSRAEATRQGHQGWVREAKIIMSSWGFRLEEIVVPIHLWYWAEDKAIPLQMGRYLAARIPTAITHFYPNGGHLSIYDAWEEIIATLLPDATRGENVPELSEAQAIFADGLVRACHASPAEGHGTAYPGLLFIMPVRPVSRLDDLQPAEAEALTSASARLSAALRDACGAEHVYQEVLEGGATGLHIRLLPRYPGTPLQFWGTNLVQWPAAPRATPDEIAALCQRLRDPLEIRDVE